MNKYATKGLALRPYLDGDGFGFRALTVTATDIQPTPNESIKYIHWFNIVHIHGVQGGDGTPSCRTAANIRSQYRRRNGGPAGYSRTVI